MSDLLEELQRMAENASCTEDVSPSKIKQWQTLFGFSYEQARDQIQRHRDDIGRQRVSDARWQMVQEESEIYGHDRESYEFSVQYHATLRVPHGRQRSTNDNAAHIIQLEPPIDAAQKIQEVVQLAKEPPIFKGKGETGPVTFCELDTQALHRLFAWLSDTHPSFRPTTIRLSRSPKQLSNLTMAPVLGLVDTTLPQNRAPTADFKPQPAQKQYPVWYFFYGNLAKSEELQRRLGLAEPPTYRAARVYGGRIRSWRGQYRALVDADTECFVDGSAYLVNSEEDEDVLRFYETKKYEVVRCGIHMDGSVQPGLVFRFAGSEADLA